MFVADWPLMFVLGLFIAATAISRGGNRFWFSVGLIVSLACVGIVMYLWKIAPDFMLTGMGLEPAHASAGLLVLFYALYVVLYAFGYTVGYYPLGRKLSDLVSMVRKRSRSPGSGP